MGLITDNFRWLVLAVAILGCCARGSLAQGEPKAGSPCWELSPYRVQICVLVEPSARLQVALETELCEELVAHADEFYGGPWQVSANQGLAEKLRKLSRQPGASKTSKLEPRPDADKLIIISLREQGDGFHIHAQEVEIPIDYWNLAVERTTTQASRLASEAFAALQAATGPTLRIDSIEKDTATVTMRAGSLPKRDGTYLPVDRNAVFGVHLQSIDKTGRPAGAPLALDWTYLTPLGTTGPTGAGRATFKCRLHTALGAKSFPEYHPLQLRLAGAIPRSTKSSRLFLMDQESTPAPLEGYEVFLAPPETNGAAAAPQRIGATNRQGELTIPAGDGGLRYLVISHGGAELLRRPYATGRGGEVKISLPNDRRRLELAAEITAAQDEFFDTMGRLTILGARRAEAMAKRDLTTLNRVLGELDSAKALPTLTSRISALEAKLAAADEATRARLAPALAQFKGQVDSLKAQLAGGSP